MKYLIIVLAILIPVIACGPFFSNSILPNLTQFEVVPLADFNDELNGFNSKSNKLNNLKDIEKRGPIIEEFAEALKYYKVKNPEEVLKEYSEIRGRIEEFRKKIKTNPDEKFPKLLIPNSFPKEYQLYLDGAVNYYEGNHSIAEKRWKELLELPKEERLYRTVWSRYMLAELSLWIDDQQYFRMNEILRLDVANGFKDVQGLAVSTLGNEGHYFYSNGEFVNAIKKFNQHHIYQGLGAKESLKFSILKLFKGEASKIEEAAKDTVVRNIITRFFISYSSDSSSQAARENWFLTLEKLNIKDVELADRLAWVAYRSGDWKLTERYLNIAEQESVITHWLLSRFALREQQKDKALLHLSKVANLLKEKDYNYGSYPNFESTEMDKFENYNLGEMAFFNLEKGQLKQSLKLFLQSEYWNDAAYLAERLLTTDELKKFIEENKAELKASEKQFIQLKSLLARKLARQGKMNEALPYYTETDAKNAAEFMKLIKQGNNQSLAKKERADALWGAAVINRKIGMELFGTELYPDVTVYEGSYEMESMGDVRLQLQKEKKISMPTIEIERLKTPECTPEKRFHYRYNASELAWQAIQLMPDNDNETAKRLIIAGSWLQAREPKLADKFYKLLVKKCGNTELGKAAEKLRWFPTLPEN